MNRLPPLLPQRMWTTGVVTFMQVPVQALLPSKRLYFLTPSVGKFWTAWKQIWQNLHGMWGNVTRKVWQLEVWLQGTGPNKFYQRQSSVTWKWPSWWTFLRLWTVSTRYPWHPFSVWCWSFVDVCGIMLLWLFLCYVGTFASISAVNSSPVWDPLISQSLTLGLCLARPRELFHFLQSSPTFFRSDC